MTSKESANRYIGECFNPFRTSSINSERGFTVLIGYIILVTRMSVNAYTALNTAPKFRVKRRQDNQKS